MYNAKNYTEQGGEKTVIGGVLEVKEGAEIHGLPSAANQAASTATTVALLKEDVNAILVKLKEAGLMVSDTMTVTAGLAATPTEEVVVANHSKVDDVAIEDDVITITVDVDELEESESSTPGQGTHKWVWLGIGTGLDDITKVKYNGSQLTEDDVTEATTCGVSAGGFVLFIKCDEVAVEPKEFTLKADGYGLRTISVKAIAPEE